MKMINANRKNVRKYVIFKCIILDKRRRRKGK